MKIFAKQVFADGIALLPFSHQTAISLAAFMYLLLHSPLLPAQYLYDTDQITRIELTFPTPDWQYPLHYHHAQNKGARELATAVINGLTFDSVGVRFKGFSSYRRTFAKNPLNIKLDYVNKKADYQKFETLKLSNGNLDPSWIREVLGYKIARKYMVAPHANYAEVYVNGSYHGLFGNTEDIDKKFAKRYLPAGKDNVIIKGNSSTGPFSGNRSSLEYLGEDPTAYAKSYELESDHGWMELMELTRILKQQPEKIETILDMNAAIWMLAFNNVLVNLDSYSGFQQNFYLVQDDNGRFHFVLWDLNLAFDGLGKPNGILMQPEYDPLAKMNDPKFPLINLVLQDPGYRKVYFAHCRTIVEENFASGWYRKEAEQLKTLIDDAVRRDTHWLFPYEAFRQNLHQTYQRDEPGALPYPGITELMEARTAYLLDHPEYKKEPPQVSDVEAFFSGPDSTSITVNARIEEGLKAFLFYRKKSSQLFQKAPLFDDGKHGDVKPGDRIYGTEIPLEGKKIQYYIFAENKEAAAFSPERASHKSYTFP